MQDSKKSAHHEIRGFFTTADGDLRRYHYGVGQKQLFVRKRPKASDAEAYLEYLFKSGIPAYRATSGNKGAWILRRIEDDVAHFITLSFWESREAIAAFAGADIEVAKYDPEDEKYLLEFEPTVTHYELFQ